MTTPRKTGLAVMDAQEIFEQLKAILVERLSLSCGAHADHRSAEGKRRFGVVMDEREDLAPHFQTLGTLTDYVRSHLGLG